MENQKLQSHWDNAYAKKAVSALGWYEENPEPSLELIEEINLPKAARILNVGAGATTLVDELLKRGYEQIIANDISSVALEKLKERIGEKGSQVEWMVDDLTQPTALKSIEKVTVWHDRAVLHFFNTKEEQATYFNLVNSLVTPGGFVIIAAFGLNGAEKCSGLPVHRYDAKMLEERLGSDFELMKAFDYTYIMPSGSPRAYIYTLFQRKA